ncbi:MAG: nitroreductase family deazaflavin-dependent oxidoreductase [Armatimonadetes bacterium]|nr:nitroreductase family deazaflavin-dependent oxidoreductase [Armatimonadota bacterium]
MPSSDAPATKPAYLYLTTTGWKSGRPHEIEIWFTSLEGQYYVIAEHGRRAHWVQNLRRNPRVTFRVDDRVHQGRARIVEEAGDPALVRRVRDLSEAKYGWGDGLIVELAPDE